MTPQPSCRQSLVEKEDEQIFINSWMSKEARLVKQNRPSFLTWLAPMDGREAGMTFAA